jgi:integrase
MPHDIVLAAPVALAHWTPLETVLAGACTPSTIRKYRQALGLYQAFCQDQGLDPLDAVSFASWRDTMALTTDLSPNTINARLAGVRKVMEVGARQRYLSTATAQEFRTTEGVSVRALRDRLKANSRTRISRTDMRRLCDYPDLVMLIGLRDRALLLTMATSGARVSEVVRLKIGAMESREGGWIIRVLGKTDVVPRDALLSQEAHQAIERWIARREVETEYIFTSFDGRGGRPQTTPMDASSAWRVIHGHAQALGLPDIKPHDFRRFVGTTLAKDNPRNAQKALGHKSLATTMDNYVLDDLEVGLTDKLF